MVFPSTLLANTESLAQILLLSGQISDSETHFHQAETLNSRILPALDILAKTSLFSHYRLRLAEPCPFWKNNMLCSLKDCQVRTVFQKDLPDVWKLGQIDTSNGKSSVFSFVPTCEYKESDFCLVEDHIEEGSLHVNLLKNPERYTGYSGESAHRVWEAIYHENCFGNAVNLLGRDMSQCREKRVFYKLISGLHASITTHICAQWLNPKTLIWEMNYECFRKRILPFTDHISNMYFYWTVMTRAMSKLAPFFEPQTFCHGSPDEKLIIVRLVRKSCQFFLSNITAKIFFFYYYMRIYRCRFY